MKTEVRIAGTGGMGVVLAGVVLAHAAVIHGGLEAVQTQSYGSEARGTSAKSEVVISDRPIKYPKVLKADYSILMSQKAFDMHISEAKEGSTVLVDPDLVDYRAYANRFDIVPVAAMRIADELGNRMMSNMVMLGAFSKRSGVVSVELLEKALRDMVPEKTFPLNSQAVRAGADAV
ncbi:MAG: 2-oxoacid:acceptor oxidoreductase family protein [Candidatus Thorarchaeota archaeon]|nr:2-oxoacid:acceptor oxidoreductase family protein [Candidatus Thorarchaeota archaeon]